MQKILYVLLSVVLVVSGVYSQYASTYVYGQFQEDIEVYAFNEEVLVRSAPSLDSEVIATLSIPDPLNIVKELDSYEYLNGYAQYWYEVIIVKDGKDHTGYVLDGALSIAAVPFSENGEDQQGWFLWNISSYDDKNYLQSQAKLVIDNKTVSTIEFSPIYTDFYPDHGYRYTIECTMVEDDGFSPQVKLFVISFIYEACAYTNGDIVISWNGNELQYGLEAISVSDAGVFYYSSEVIYPSLEQGVANQITVIEEQGEFDETLNDYTLVSEKTTVYTWNGTKMVKEE